MLPEREPTPEQAILLTYHVVRGLEIQMARVAACVNVLEHVNSEKRLSSLEGRLQKIELWQAGVVARLVLTTGAIGAVIGAVMSQAVGWITSGTPLP